MDKQFIDLLLPDNNTLYISSFHPETMRLIGSTKWNHLMKLVTMIKRFPEVIDIIECILLFNPNEIEKTNLAGNTALIIAATNCNHCSSIECLKILINSGANINHKNASGWTSLMYACCYANFSSSMECVKLLIDSGSNVNETDNNDRSSLMISSRNAGTTSNIECVRLLINSGANIDAQYNNGYTSLICACHWIDSLSSIKCVHLLIDSGANVNIKDDDGTTALMHLFLNNYVDKCAIPADIVDTIMLLIHKSKLTICDRDIFGKTACNYYTENNFTILENEQLEYLSGTKVLSRTKSAKKIE